MLIFGGGGCWFSGVVGGLEDVEISHVLEAAVSVSPIRNDYSMQKATKARHSAPTLAVTALLILVPACDGTREGASTAATMGGLQAHAVFGGETQGDANSVVGKVLDGVLLEDRVALLAGNAPYVRFFSFDGEFLGSAIAHGRGPEELRRPVSIGRIGGQTVLINEPSKLLKVTPDGGVLEAIVDPDRMLRGAVGCGGGLLTLSTPPGFQQPGDLVFTTVEEPLLIDTVMYLDSIRGNSRRAHPLFAHSGTASVVLYTEETTSDRLVWVDCGTRAVNDVPLDSLGAQETWEHLEGDQYALHPAAAPRPGGVIRFGGRILWARQEILAEGTDSVTTISVVSDGLHRRNVIQMHGWYHLVDATDDLVLLISRSPVSHAVLWDDAMLQAVVAQEGL